MTEAELWKLAWEHCPDSAFHGWDGSYNSSKHLKCSKCWGLVSTFKKLLALPKEEGRVWE